MSSSRSPATLFKLSRESISGTFVIDAKGLSLINVSQTATQNIMAIRVLFYLKTTLL